MQAVAMGWKTILVPHDFSASAEHAVAIARDEAKLHGAQIVLLHVVELVHNLGPETDIIVRPGTTTPVSRRLFFMETAEADLAPVVAALAADGVTATIATRSGSPVDEIREYVRDHPIDAIVMGTHGRTGLRHLIIGSVAEQIVRTSPVPVLTIRHPDPPAT
jgi:nucleotide-binding universal stress UspA family protein